jgi:oligoribonuclease NrnB/cAMP/cGMP phosphodiesterase (DHH superfamily)
MTDKIYDIVFFHYPCQDGLTSAWIAHYFHKLNHKSITLYPIQHEIKIDMTELENKKILFCDYSPSLKVLNEMEKIVNKIKILDHHKSAEQEISSKDYATFDMNKSGAGLTWEYFFSVLPKPKFVEMVQDRDLWTWKIPESRDFTSGLFTLCDTCDLHDFDNLFEIFNDLLNIPEKYNFCVQLGSIVSKANLNKAKNLVNSHSTKIDNYKGYRVCIVNCPYDLASDVGNMLSSMNTIDFAVLWRYNHSKETYAVSLRSDNKVDVSEIAKEHGGGGHKNASGCATKTIPTILFSTP